MICNYKRLSLVIAFIITVLAQMPSAALAGDGGGAAVPSGFKRISDGDEEPEAETPESAGEEMIPPKAPAVPGVPNVSRDMRKRIENRLDAIKKRVVPARFRPPSWDEISSSAQKAGIPHIPQAGYRLPEAPSSRPDISGVEVLREVQNLFYPDVPTGSEPSDINVLLMPSLMNLWAGNQYIPRSFHLPGN